MSRILNRLLGFRNLSIYIRFVLEIMPEEFDSHDFIAAFAFQNQSAYSRALWETGWNDQPFQTINDAIIHWLEKSGTVRQIGTRESENMFKQVHSAAVWRKVA